LHPTTPVRTISKERPISTTISSSVKPSHTGVLLHQPRRPTGVPNWLKTVPFVFFHLIAIPAAFLVGVDGTALALLAATYFIRMFGITGVYHRYFAHRAYKTSRPVQFLLAWLGCSALQKGPLWWSGHHRVHHRHSDTPEDPHSPYETSFWWSHVGWILSDEHSEIAWDDVRDWARYPELRWLDRYHWVPGILLGVACFLIGGWSGLVWGFLISTILVYHATFTINSLSHLFGKRRYNTPDDSRNNIWLALITLGEGWHNNHHHYQSSANQGFFWWEIDISFYVIRLMGLCRLVWDIRKPGEKAINFRLVQPARRAAAVK
jgi:stearoyl-CoA desaturase (delta-9 desaturase)